MKDTQGRRIESIQSYERVQLSGRFDIVDEFGVVVMRVNLSDKSVDFMKDLRFFNEAGNLFASISQNTTNEQILDLFSNIGIDIKAPTFKIDYLDPYQGKNVKVGLDGLLMPGNSVIHKQMEIDTTQAVIPKNVETLLPQVLTLTKDVYNPEIHFQLDVNENEAKDFVFGARYYLNGVPQKNFNLKAVSKAQEETLTYDLVVPGVLSDGDQISISVAGTKDFVVNESIIKIQGDESA